MQYHASGVLPGADKGLEHALRAAQEATAGTAHERAVTLLRIAGDLASSRDAGTRAEVWCRLALAEGDALLLAEAEQSIVRALDTLAEAGAEPRATAKFLAVAVRKLRDGGAPPSVCERFVERGTTTRTRSSRSTGVPARRPRRFCGSPVAGGARRR